MKALITRFLRHESCIFQFYFELKYLLARLCFGYFYNDFEVIAYTGTNGKSTCANLMYQSLNLLGEKVALISTVNMAIGSEVYANTKKMTSLDVFDFYRFLKKCRANGVKYLVLEYSSHAYVQKRLKGLKFRQVNLTSLSSDHIEYHGSKAKYWGVKLDIIRSIISNSSSAKFFYNQSSKECLSKGLDADDVLEVGVEYGLDAFQGSSLLANVEFSLDQTKFTLDGQEIVSPLISSTNLNNILGIYVQLLDLGFDKENVLGILPSLERVKGRFEFFENSKFNVVLDYAHAEDSMENILKFFNQELNLPVVIVFGATGGGRDVLKRPRMGKVAEKYARKIILTSDDPYMDDPKVIAEDILEGISNQDIVEVEVDRRKAIYRAFEVSDKETLIVILGKAGEEVMMINGELIEFSDIKIVEDYLEKNV